MTRLAVALVLLALLAAPLVPDAQQAGKVWRIGFLSLHRPASAPAAEARLMLTEALRARGYVEGVNLAIEWRWAEGETVRLAQFADELVGLAVDIIVAQTNPEAVAARAATATIPIVVTGLNNPVETGW